MRIILIPHLRLQKEISILVNRDNSKKRVSAVKERGEASVAQENRIDQNFAKSEVFSLTGNQQDSDLEGDNQTSHFGK